MSKPRKFTSTIYCGNCRNVGDYEFKRRTRLVCVSKPWADSDIIHLDNKEGKLVECKFCGLPDELRLRGRNGDANSPVVPDAPAAPVADSEVASS